MPDRLAKLAPPSQSLPTIDDLRNQLNQTLDGEFCLRPLPRFCALVEGWTDVGYLEKAARLHQEETGENLLSVDATENIGIFTPGMRNNPKRGGCKQMVKLAQELAFYVFRLQVVDGIVFVFDHDDAGIEAANSLDKLGYQNGRHRMTLDPKEHPNACYSKGVVIEDLLSLRIQQDFFETHPSWCDVRYEEGKLLRFTWREPSKYALRDYVLENAQLPDVTELVSLLKRLRKAFSLPIER